MAEDTWRIRTILIVRIVISAVSLFAALYVILSNNKYPDADVKWAFGIVGLVIGYWLR